MDVRKIINSQEIIETLLHLVVKNHDDRRLVYLQRNQVVLEPGVMDSSDSEHEFEDFYADVKEVLNLFDIETQNHSDKGEIHEKLMRGVFEKKALKDANRNSKRREQLRPNLLDPNSETLRNIQRGQVPNLFDIRNETTRKLNE